MRRGTLLLLVQSAAFGVLLATVPLPLPAAGSSAADQARAAFTAVRTVRVPLEDGVVGALSDEGLFLEAVPKRGEGLLGFTRRLSGDSRLAPQVMEANGGSKDLQVGVRYRFPFDLLSQEWQMRLLRALFPDDKGEADGWRHQVRGVGLPLLAAGGVAARADVHMHVASGERAQRNKERERKTGCFDHGASRDGWESEGVRSWSTRSRKML